MPKSLQELREQIDQIDSQLLDLLNQRAQLARFVGELKASNNAPVLRPEREAQIMRNLQANNSGPLRVHDLEIIFREIISACRSLEKRVGVAYLGPIGTFSEQAVYKHFGQAIEGKPCHSIDEVFRVVEAGDADFGVIPVENSTEGTINRTLDLLLQTRLLISAEIVLPIHHNLMTSTGSMQGVKHILAHSQALAQCQSWLKQNYSNITTQAVASNGEAARTAAEENTVAAIAGEVAAKQYGLQIIASHIQDDAHNCTRFAVIGELQTEASGHDQTSLILSVPNKAGAVYDMLAPIARHQVSMTRFESRPARMGAWEYYFYIDVKGHQRTPKIAAMLSELKQAVSFFKILGSYPAGELA